ncbi:hypothetical protein MNEG_3012 [Monoraphidium neglectum]|uniref:Protein-serine/threonine phosphatase n=1 Tax=Monoraphidium neglectum TaxID=145388 RepID=A0A0D2LE13_9CHLO|nr:hypothetical protein MNEG_3012 [Monoraphidium neglectum]KIZ04949.1 hypothetical protein MNEG_3012 [Monoraphidium neglectum]|eukprot:XP_013903968.1 hypothetical protein MNEG_3012 [Monoraphidium neglectum]
MAAPGPWTPLTAPPASSSSSGGPSQLRPYLLLGSLEDALDITALRRAGVTHIVNATAEHAPAFPGAFEHLRVAVRDAPGERLGPHWRRVDDFIRRARDAGGAAGGDGGCRRQGGQGVRDAGSDCSVGGRGVVLLHCEQGVSRSVSLAVAHLMLAEHLTLAQALAAVRSVRPQADPNPGFMRELRALDAQLQSERDRNGDGSDSGAHLRSQHGVAGEAATREAAGRAAGVPSQADGGWGVAGDSQAGALGEREGGAHDFAEEAALAVAGAAAGCPPDKARLAAAATLLMSLPAAARRAAVASAVRQAFEDFGSATKERDAAAHAALADVLAAVAQCSGDRRSGQASHSGQQQGGVPAFQKEEGAAIVAAALLDVEAGEAWQELLLDVPMAAQLLARLRHRLAPPPDATCINGAA